MAVHVRFESLYISLPSSAKQQREMTKSYVFLGTCTAMDYFSCLPFELYPTIPHFSLSRVLDRYRSPEAEQIYTVATFQGKI